MTLECINPTDLPVPEMYTQVVVATGSRLVFVSGHMCRSSKRHKKRCSQITNPQTSWSG
jgi:hypothetical protein